MPSRSRPLSECVLERSRTRPQTHTTNWIRPATPETTPMAEIQSTAWILPLALHRTYRFRYHPQADRHVLDRCPAFDKERREAEVLAGDERLALLITELPDNH